MKWLLVLLMFGAVTPVFAECPDGQVEMSVMGKKEDAPAGKLKCPVLNAVCTYTNRQSLRADLGTICLTPEQLAEARKP